MGKRGRLATAVAPPALAAFLPVVLVAAFVLAVATPALARGTSCPEGWQISPVQNKCFMYISASISWDRSEALCHNNYSGHLAALSSVQELNFAKSLCGSSASGCWVGGHQYNTSTGNGWKWSDDSSAWNETVFPVELLHGNCSGALNPML
nr:unnamed protein product [Digitaria exilis]